MTIEQMMNELKHYVQCDVEDMTVREIIETYVSLFGEEI
jgi:hypothetical protein